MRVSRILAATLIATPLFVSSGQALTLANGKVVATFSDPDDVVIELDVPGQCGSKYFHVQRAKKNFREMTAAALAAAAGGKRMLLYVESCAGDRNILSHGAILS